jgi:hypothetical protein
MTFWPFKRDQLLTVSEALDIAEDNTGDFYRFSAGQWRRHRYDIRTLSELKRTQIVPHAFAFLNKGMRASSEHGVPRKNPDYYFICLQDHVILKALKRDGELGLLPLLVYVFTHELVHIVRFSNFLQRFEISARDRDKEERIVHAITHEILKDLSLPKLDYVLESYQNHRICELATA